MIQVVTFDGSNDTLRDATSEAAQKANEFLTEHKIASEMIFAQTTNSNSVVCDGEIWILFTITLFLNLPFSLEYLDHLNMYVKAEPSKTETIIDPVKSPWDLSKKVQEEAF
jgi:hypothetical protein